MKTFAAPVTGSVEIQTDRLILFCVPKLHFAATVCSTNSYVTRETGGTESWYVLTANSNSYCLCVFVLVCVCSSLC